MKNKEIINRRELFKKAAKTIVPILVGVTIMPGFIVCNKDKSIEEAISSCDGGRMGNCFRMLRMLKLRDFLLGNCEKHWVFLV